jgi:hypothetical protein
VGYQRNLFVRDFWKFIDVDTAELQRRTGASTAASAVPKTKPAPP